MIVQLHFRLVLIHNVCVSVVLFNKDHVVSLQRIAHLEVKINSICLFICLIIIAICLIYHADKILSLIRVMIILGY